MFGRHSQVTGNHFHQPFAIISDEQMSAPLLSSRRHIISSRILLTQFRRMDHLLGFLKTVDLSLGVE